MLLANSVTVQPVEKFPSFKEPEAPLQFLQGLATYLSFEPDESTPLIVFLYDPFQYELLLYHRRPGFPIISFF
jgi:hypothetical protein